MTTSTTVLLEDKTRKDLAPSPVRSDLTPLDPFPHSSDKGIHGQQITIVQNQRKAVCIVIIVIVIVSAAAPPRGINAENLSLSKSLGMSGRKERMSVPNDISGSQGFSLPPPTRTGKASTSRGITTTTTTAIAATAIAAGIIIIVVGVGLAITVRLRLLLLLLLVVTSSLGAAASAMVVMMIVSLIAQVHGIGDFQTR